MAKQTINQGTAPTGVGGDSFRSGSAKLQANDDEIYGQLGATAQGVLPAALPINKGGTGATTAAAARTNLGLGTAATQRFSAAMGETAPIDIDAYFEPCVGMFKRISMATPPESNAVWGFLIQATSGGSGGSDRTLQIFGNDTSTNLYYRKNSHPAIGAWRKFLSSGNTTTDANGFIKAASPIVKLFADGIELNDEAQQQNIKFEKLGVGDYLIKGSTGFAQEGWYVETPKDANGNVLFSVIYTTLENGDISVKTYKKKA